MILERGSQGTPKVLGKFVAVNAFFRRIKVLAFDAEIQLAVLFSHRGIDHGRLTSRGCRGSCAYDTNKLVPSSVPAHQYATLVYRLPLGIERRRQSLSVLSPIELHLDCLVEIGFSKSSEVFRDDVERLMDELFRLYCANCITIPDRWVYNGRAKTGFG